MLEMVRQFGLRRLEGSGELETMLDRCAAVLVDMAERSFADGDRGDWPMIIESEYDNIRAVLIRTIANEQDIESGVRLCGSLSRFWFNHGYVNEALHWTELAIAKDDRSRPEASARCLMAGGFFFGQMPGSSDDTGKRRSYFEQSIKLWRELGDRRNLGVTLIGYAFMLNRLGEYDAAIKAAEESLETFRGTEFHFNAARAANNLALTLLDIGEFVRAGTIIEEALIASRRSNDVFLAAVCLHNMGDVALQTGEFDKAEDFLRESLELFNGLGQRPLIARTVLLQGEVAAERGRFDEALKLERDALLDLKELGENHGIAVAFEALATTFALKGNDNELALTLQSAAESLRKKIGIDLTPARKKRFQVLMKKARSAAGKPAAEGASRKGSTISAEELIQLVSAQEIGNSPSEPRK